VEARETARSFCKLSEIVDRPSDQLYGDYIYIICKLDLGRKRARKLKHGGGAYWAGWEAVHPLFDPNGQALLLILPLFAVPK